MNYLSDLKIKQYDFGILSGTTPLFPKSYFKKITPNFTTEESRKRVEYEAVKSLIISLTGYSACELTVGASEAFLLFLLFLKRKKTDRIVFEVPYYQPYLLIAQHLGFSIEFAYRQFESEFLEIASIKRITKKSAIIISNPNFYYGTRIKNEDIFKLANIFKYVLLDEVHLPQFTKSNSFGSGIKSKNVFSINSLAKSMGLSSLRFGWIAGEDEYIKILSEISLYSHVDMPTIPMISAYKALLNKDLIITKIKSDYAKNSTLLRESILSFENKNIKLSHSFLNGHFAAIKGKNLNYSHIMCPSSYFGIKGLFRFRIDRPTKTLQKLILELRNV